MKIEGKANLLTIYIGENDKHHHRPLYQVIVEMLRKQGIAGATVVRGIEGFGKKSRIHTAAILRLSEDLPIIITVIDKEERINQVMPLIDELVTEGLVIIENVDVISYRAEQDGQKS
jgi:hypothetical protein